MDIQVSTGAVLAPSTQDVELQLLKYGGVEVKPQKTIMKQSKKEALKPTSTSSKA